MSKIDRIAARLNLLVGQALVPHRPGCPAIMADWGSGCNCGATEENRKRDQMGRDTMADILSLVPKDENKHPEHATTSSNDDPRVDGIMRRLDAIERRYAHLAGDVNDLSMRLDGIVIALNEDSEDLENRIIDMEAKLTSGDLIAYARAREAEKTRAQIKAIQEQLVEHARDIATAKAHQV